MSTTRFYKIESGTKTYASIGALLKRIDDAFQASRQLALELGSPDGVILQNLEYAAGDLLAIKMESQPEGWKKVLPACFPGYYFPKKIKANRDILQRIQHLPSIHRSELSRLLGYDSQIGAPGLVQSDDLLLVHMPHGFNNVHPEPTPDMIEITGFEYLQLSKTDDIAFEVIPSTIKLKR